MAEGTNLPTMRTEHITCNIDVRNLWMRFQRVIEEVMLCDSSNTNAMRDDDLERLTDNLRAFRSAANQAINGPQLDTPYVSPREYNLQHWFDDQAMLENDDLDHIRVLLVTARDDLAKSSQSNRTGNCLHVKDGRRLIRMLDRVDQHVTEVITEHNPMDYPETTPTVAMSPAGRSGI